MSQLDIFDHDPLKLAVANREAAKTAAINPYFTLEEWTEREAYYLAEAERLEALAGKGRPT